MWSCTLTSDFCEPERRTGMRAGYRGGLWLVVVATAVIIGLTIAAHAQQGNAVLLATQADVARLDPAATGDVPSMMVQSVIFEGLVGWDKDGKLVPQLAESWTYSDGGKVVTFKLHRGVKFHDGEEF